jgi:quinol monooxygenase YgiN
VSAFLLLAAPATGQEEENPIVTFVKERVPQPDKPFTLLVRLRAKEGSGEKLEKAFAPAITASRKEKGCLAYNLDHDPKQADQYLVYERWKSVKDLEAHLKAPYIKALLAALPDLTTGRPEPTVLVPAGE